MRKKKLALPPDVRAFFSAASAKRQRVERNCAVCNRPMGAVILKRLYCSPACSKRASRERLREREQQATTPAPAEPERTRVRQERLRELQARPVLTEQQVDELAGLRGGLARNT